MEANLTDLELVDKYCEECMDFINPIIFRQIKERGLYNIINFLPKNTAEAKAVARGRMSKMKKYFGDSEIDQIAGEIQRINFLREKIVGMNMADVDKTTPLLQEMIQRSEFVRDYYKK